MFYAPYSDVHVYIMLVANVIHNMQVWNVGQRIFHYNLHYNLIATISWIRYENIGNMKGSRIITFLSQENLTKKQVFPAPYMLCISYQRGVVNQTFGVKVQN